MRVRAQSASGDYTFGQGGANFLVNSPAAVGQLMSTRLKLLQGEWFVDITDGTPYSTQILGTGTRLLYDNAVQQRILGTPGVIGIAAYASSVNTTTRQLVVQATVDTLYGQITINEGLTLSVPAPGQLVIPPPRPVGGLVGQLDFTQFGNPLIAGL